MSQLGLFARPAREVIGPEAVVIHGFALPSDPLYEALESIVAQAPFRHMITPGGYAMSVAMSNCGQLGWVTDKSGYRYTSDDPLSGKPWPQMPALFAALAEKAASAAGFPGFVPDACLINRYEPGAKMSLHQDKNERDFRAPIVSVSLGLPAVFQFGGLERASKTQHVPLEHGDVVVWGGASRSFYHGVLPLKGSGQRINLTFRLAS